MRLAFFGTPDFAAVALGALLAAGHDVCAVYSQPPRPARRGQRPHKSAVQQLAEANALNVRTPTSLKPADVRTAFIALQAEIAVVVAYGLILPQAILQGPRHGCLNIHASLLPRWRGAAPIHRAVQAGDQETGISIMVMEQGLDTGPVLLTRRMAIAPLERGAINTNELWCAKVRLPDGQEGWINVARRYAPREHQHRHQPRGCRANQWRMYFKLVVISRCLRGGCKPHWLAWSWRCKENC